MGQPDVLGTLSLVVVVVVVVVAAAVLWVVVDVLHPPFFLIHLQFFFQCVDVHRADSVVE